MSKIDLQSQIQQLLQSPGVYLFKDNKGEVLYVGKSVRLRDRVKSYYQVGNNLGPKTKRMIREIKKIDCIETESEIEALILEAELIKKHKPRYNTQWKDDKTYQFVKIENGKLRIEKGIRKMVKNRVWPWVTTSRQKDDLDALYFGPFPEGRTVKEVLKALRKIFPWCKYKSAQQKKRQKKPRLRSGQSFGGQARLRSPEGKANGGQVCLYYHLGLCPGICADKVSLRDYWKTIDQLVLFLLGKKKLVQRNIKKHMDKAAKMRDFEKAAYYRDLSQKIDYVTQNFRDSSEYLENPNLKQDLRRQEVEELLEKLRRVKMFEENHQKHPTGVEGFRIEGYDISNLGKDFTVGSRVVFVGGEPVKSEYRRYKIKTDKLPDDYTALEEVLTRRFNPPVSKKDNLPDLILIDGGKGQLSIARKVLVQKKLDLLVTGLAKQHETLIISIGTDRYQEVLLPQDSPALKLVMRVRDESHRFAKAYHKLLRRKSLQE